MPKNVLDRFTAEPLRRTMSVGKIDAESRTVELAFSSDVELERWPGVCEKLSHEAGACDLTRLNDKASLLFNHDANEVLGVVESARIDNDGFGRAVVRFGKSEDAEEAWQDVQDGILSKVSVGYRISEVKLTQESDSGPDVYTVTRWQPYEISIVSIPADMSVGIGRSATEETTPPAAQPKPIQKVRIIMNREQLIALLEKRGVTVTEAMTDADLTRMVSESEPQKISVEGERAAGRQTEQSRVNGIIAVGEKYGMQDVALRAIQEGKSLDETRGIFLEEMNKRNVSVKDASKPIGLSDKEAKSFSIVKLMRALAADPADRGSREAAKFELEACAAAADQVKHRALKGTMIPVDVLTAPFSQRGTDTISIASGAGYTGTGGNTVQTQLQASSFIDILRNRTILMQLGTTLSGLVGNLDIPKQLTGNSGYWIGEDADATKGDMDFGLISLRPKTVANYSEITRRMLQQPSVAVEALVRADLARGLAQTIDLAGFYGTGDANDPTGIKETDGINAIDFAGVQPTFAELVAMETAIALDNADVENMAYIANASFRGYAKTTRKISTSTDSNTIWEPGNSVNGYRTEITNQVATGDVFFGNFADMILGLWGGLEITVDPYTHSAKGRVRIVTMQDVDIAIRRAASFAYGVKP